MAHDIDDNTLASPELIAALIRQIRTHAVDDDYEMALATRDQLYRMTLRTTPVVVTPAHRQRTRECDGQ